MFAKSSFRFAVSALAACFFLLVVPRPASATVVNVVGGTLYGASGVMVDGTSYDVSFVDGSCDSLFDGCDPSHFAFTTQTGATDASQALLNFVFLDTSLGNFDSSPGLTNGCSSTVVCNVITPFFAYSSSTLFSAIYAVNVAEPPVSPYNSDETKAVSGMSATFGIDISGSPMYVFAVWSPTSTVPLPSTALLFGSGLLVLVFARRACSAKRVTTR